jgi:hypothetical protein
MGQFILGTVLPVVGTIALGAIGWFLSQFLARPLVRFFDLRQQAHEQLFFTANVYSGTEEASRFERACEDLRRTAAQLSACESCMLSPLRRLIYSLGYDIGRTIRGLTGLSNVLERHDEKAIFRHEVELGLKLPPHDPPERIAQIIDRIDRGRELT